MKTAIKNIWNADPSDDRLFIQKTLLEFIFYFTFLIAVSLSISVSSVLVIATNYQLIFPFIVSYGMAGSTMYYMSDMLTKLFIDMPYQLKDSELERTFRELSTVTEYWEYVETLLIDNIYGSDKDENKTRIFKHPFTKSNSTDVLEIFGENIFLGPPRLRQLKVTNGSCQVHKLFQRNFCDCFGPFSFVHIDRQPFGLKNGTA